MWEYDTLGNPNKFKWRYYCKTPVFPWYINVAGLKKGKTYRHKQCEKLQVKRCLPRHETWMGNERARRHTLDEGVGNHCTWTQRNKSDKISVDEFVQKIYGWGAGICRAMGSHSSLHMPDCLRRFHKHQLAVDIQKVKGSHEDKGLLEWIENFGDGRNEPTIMVRRVNRLRLDMIPRWCWWKSDWVRGHNHLLTGKCWGSLVYCDTMIHYIVFSVMLLRQSGSVRTTSWATMSKR